MGYDEMENSLLAAVKERTIPYEQKFDLRMLVTKVRRHTQEDIMVFVASVHASDHAHTNNPRESGQCGH